MSFLIPQQEPARCTQGFSSSVRMERICSYSLIPQHDQFNSPTMCSTAYADDPKLAQWVTEGGAGRFPVGWVGPASRGGPMGLPEPPGLTDGIAGPTRPSRFNGHGWRAGPVVGPCGLVFGRDPWLARSVDQVGRGSGLPRGFGGWGLGFGGCGWFWSGTWRKWYHQAAFVGRRGGVRKHPFYVYAGGGFSILL